MSKQCQHSGCTETLKFKSLCDKHRMALHRRETNNAATHRYEKTVNGFLMRTYNNMKGRVLGIQKHKAHLYKGKALLERKVFYVWARSNSEFLLLFNSWEKNGYTRKLTPSIDRIDSTQGYVLDNMQWLSMRDNSAKATRERWAKR